MDYSKVMLFSDLDGTLFDDQKNVPESNKEAIRRFCEAGGYFGLSSGRIPENIRTFLDGKGVIINGPSILYNGSAIYDWNDREYIRKATLNMDVVDGFLRGVLESNPEANIQVYPEGKICFISPEELVNKKFYSLHQPSSFVDIDEVDRPWLKILIQDDPKILYMLKEKGEKIPDIGDLIISEKDYLEILPAGVNKGTALDEVMKLPLAKGRISIAVGDFYNDIELLKHADIAIAPANGIDEVKQIADFVGCDNNEGIIADCINRIIPEL